ncbi:MAG: hypothetical protein RJQ00_04970 [Vicingaceae bacterium]
MKTNIPEEESLTTVIRDIQHLIQTFMKWVLNILKKIGAVIGTLFSSWKKLAFFGLIGGALGASSLLIIPREYASDLVVRTYIDANEQLFTDIEYINTLIQADRYDDVKNLLGLDVEKIKKINSIEITSTATITERLTYLDEVWSELDSTLKKNLIIDDLLNDDQYSFTNKFKISIYSNSPFAFEGFETSILNYLERVPELNELLNSKLRILKIQKDLYESEIADLDSLKTILNNVMIKQSEPTQNNEVTINMGQSGENAFLSPLDIYTQVNIYTQRIVEIEEQLPLFESCYFVVSHLNEIGHKSGVGGLLRAIYGSILFVLVASIFVIIKSFRISE